jgi:hypothetical protein
VQRLQCDGKLVSQHDQKSRARGDELKE